MLFSKPPINDYLFSIHLNSDLYPALSLQQFAVRGARTASLLYEDYGGSNFYNGIGQGAAKILDEVHMSACMHARVGACMH